MVRKTPVQFRQREGCACLHVGMPRVSQFWDSTDEQREITQEQRRPDVHAAWTEKARNADRGAAGGWMASKAYSAAHQQQQGTKSVSQRPRAVRDASVKSHRRGSL